MQTATRDIMGMPITISVPNDAPHQLVERAFARLSEIDNRYSTYKPESEISRFNAGQVRFNQLSSEMRAILAACKQATKHTDGYFNATRGGITDPSGYVKGWAIAQAAAILEPEINSFFIDAGGDIVAHGAKPDGSPWLIGIRHPTQTTKLAKTFRVTDKAIATSGNYERGSHIYNPHTGKPARELLSVTVVGKDIIWADVYATAVFAMGSEGLSFVEKLNGYEAYVVTRDDQAIYTTGLDRYVTG